MLNNWKIAVVSSSTKVPVLIVEHLAVNPYLTIKKISEDLDIAYTTAQRGIQKLEAAEIIKQIDHGKRDKIYCATQLLEILEEPTRINAGR